ncbi:ABC transporter permease [Salipiger sp.]|uniref:ABC transporter permease n=1 Tax=Salipiger sp. TaxID=2078585 RepID=UPI003A9750D5
MSDRSPRTMLLGGADRIALYAIPFSVTAVVFIPILFLLITAFSDGSFKGADTNFTLSTMIAAYGDPKLLKALTNSLLMGVEVSLLSTLIAIPMAWVLVRADVPFRRQFTRFMTLAFYMSPLFLAIAWAAIGAPRSGLLSQTARALGFSGQNLGNIYSYGGIIFVTTIHFVPISFLLISSAFTAAAGEMDDASQMSRAGLVRTFRSITLPLITPTIVSSLLQVGVFASEQFAVPYFLGIQFNFQTLPTQIYIDLSLSDPDYNRAAAGGTMLLWFSAVGIYLFRRYMKMGDRYAAMAGKSARMPRPVELGLWKWVAAGIIAFYLFLSVVAPILALLWGSLRRFPTPELTLDGMSFYNWTAMFNNPQMVTAIKNTLVLAGLGGICTVVVCLFISFFIVRTKAKGRVVVDYVIAFPVAVPSIVLGLGVLAFYFSTPLPLYGTLFGLGLAYAMRYMGYGVRSINAGLQQVHSELTEAAYMSRASGAKVIRDIQFPLLRPTLANTWVVLFVKYAQEVNLTVLLYTQATVTMPLIIFNQLDSALLNAVYPVTLLLIGVTFLCIESIRLIPGYNTEMGHVTKRRRRGTTATPALKKEKAIG